jgi:hypothetical protein
MFTNFRQEYGKLSDEELLQLASDRSSLIEEANAALDSEMRNRGLTHDDQAKHQDLVKRYEQRERRRRVRKLLGNRRDRDSWIETAVMLFWSALAIALISIVYIALPSPYHFSPDWQEAAEYLMIGSVIIVAASFGPWLRRRAFWISLLISSVAHAVVVHTWIVRTGSLDGYGHRGERKLAVLVGPVLFLVVYGCGFLLRRKFYGEEAGSDSG